MRPLKLAVVLASSALILASCGGDATGPNQAADASNSRPANVATAANAARATPTPDEFAAARELYANECKRCHQEDGRGGVFEEPGLKPFKVPSLREGHALEHTDAQLARQISNGGDWMPAYKGRLTPEQIDQLVAFVRKEFQGRAPGASPSAPPASAH